MKNKLKYLILFILGLCFIPSTFAFELKTFSGDPEEVEVVSSKEYNGATYYYKRISWGDFFQCIEKNDVINETNSGDYVSSPATPAMTCPTGKVLKFRRWRSNFYWGYRQNWSQPLDWEIDFWYYGYNRLQPQFYLVRNGFWGKFFMIQQLKNDKGQTAFMYWQADYRWDWKLTTSIGSSQYAIGLPNMYWVHLFKSGQEEVEGSTFFQGKFWLHKMILTNYYTPNNINYTNLPVVLIDTHKHLVYEYASDIKALLKDNFQYIDLWLLDNCPAKIREYHFWAWTEKISFNWDLFSKKGGYSILNTNWRDLTEKECATYKKDIKDRMIYNMDYLNFMRGATEGDKDLQNKSLKEYNQCVLYYSSIKTYTTYDRECYKDLLDNNKWIEKWQEIKDRDWEWEWPETDSSVCVSWKKYKAAYKNKYNEKREEFLNLSKENWFAPHGIDIKVYCGEKPKKENESGFIDKTVDFMSNYWDKLTGREKIWTVNWQLISKKDYDESLINLGILRNKCDNPYSYMFLIPVWQRKDKMAEYKSKFCKEYEEALAVHNKKFWNMVLNDKYKQDYWTGKEVDNLGLSKLISYFSPSYESWFNFIAGKMWVCKNPVISEEWDFLVYIPFFMFSLFIIKYLFF